MTEARISVNRIPPGERRREILREATTLFADQGFDRTTMDDIARAANITKRTLYRYVTSKEDLLYEIHDSFTDQSLIHKRRGDDVVADLKELIRAHVRMVAEHRTEISVFFEERKHLTGAGAKLIETRRDAYESHVAQLISAGTASGDFVDLNPRPAAQGILGGMTEMYRWYRADGLLSPAALAESYIDLFMRGAAIDRQHVLAEVAPPVAPRHQSPDDGPRERVRASAIRQFAEAGFHATSIRDLADVADVTKGAVMYHARYKHRLLEEIHETTFRAGTAALLAADPGPTTHAVDRVYALLVAHLNFLAPQRDAIAVANENMRYLEPEAYARIEVLRAEWLNVFRGALDHGIAIGQLRYLDAGQLTRTLVGMLNSTARWYDPRGPLPPDEIALTYTRLFMFGLSTSAG